MYKKFLKGIVVFVLMFSVVFIGIKDTYATQSFTWSSAKIPGTNTTSKTIRKMYYYTGNIHFKATELTTDSSYVAGKCIGNDITINNANKYVLVSRINVPASFKIKPTTDGRTYMKFDLYVEHNATTYQNVYGEGTLYY